MRIPSIGVDKAVVEGVSVSDLKKGPGHYPHTPLPGQKGNVAIAGHRTTYGAPFGNIDALKAGDRIFITTRDGEFQYNVESQKIVNPGDGAAVLASTDDSRLTLTTCHPKYSASKRLIVTAKLVGAPIPTPTTAVAQSTTTAPQATTAVAQSTTSALNSTSSVPKTATPSTVAGSSGFEGNDSKGSAEFPAFAWGALATMVYVGMKVAAAKWKRIAAHAIGYPLFLLVLFMFFENFSRLLPSNI